jgi:hypothetical protein
VTIYKGSSEVTAIYKGSTSVSKAYKGETQVFPDESAYTGPLDLVPGAVVAYSMRAMTAGSTANAIRLRESGGDTEQTFALANNTVDLSAVSAFLGANDGFSRTWFDQSGNGKDSTQTTAGFQPQWVTSVMNSRPGFISAGGSWDIPELTFAGHGITVFAVIKTPGASAGNTIFAVEPTQSSDYIYVEFASSSQCDFYDGTQGCGASYSGGLDAATSYVADGAWEFGSHSLRFNGASQNQGSDFDSGVPDTITRVAALSPNSGVTICELIVYDGKKSDADRLAVRQNIAAYYGLTLP